jgi:hypothetical protein
VENFNAAFCSGDCVPVPAGSELAAVALDSGMNPLLGVIALSMSAAVQTICFLYSSSTSTTGNLQHPVGDRPPSTYLVASTISTFLYGDNDPLRCPRRFG